MKTLILLVMMTLPILAEPIPLRSPRIGESRPSWWWSCWLDNVVVLEGTIIFADDKIADVEVKISAESAKKSLTPEELKFHKNFSKFYMGRFKPDKLLFAAPGLERSNGHVGAMVRGVKNEINVLIPLMQTADGLKTLSVWNNRRGIYVFRQSYLMMTSAPMVVDEQIPKHDLESAELIFKHRNKFDHTKK